MITTTKVQLPRFGTEPSRPEIPVGIYQQRMASTRARMRAAGFDFLVVYGDREHFANLAYLTGFDPRFEEAVLLIEARSRALLVVGNECMGFLPDSRIGLEVQLFQEFSLMGQPRGNSPPLRKLLRGFGIRSGKQIGCVGWKYFEPGLVEGGPQALELPSYLVDVLRDLAGDRRRVRNATDFFMNPADGLRVINEVEQLVCLEEAAICTSEGVRQVLAHLREGVEERDLERWLDSRGIPLSCHKMVSFGAKAQRGLASPGAGRARLGEAYTIGFGVSGSLTCRAGVLARSARDLPAVTRGFYPEFAANYFDVVTAWYEQMKVGALAGEIFRAVDARRNAKLYDFAVNPGHHIHLDEWVHSPFAAGSRVALRSGMALQMDIIPVSKGPFCCINAEDGIALADEALRADLARQYPGCWLRVQKRRSFMRDALGIRLDESVLPLGNMPGWLPPYALAPETVFRA